MPASPHRMPAIPTPPFPSARQSCLGQVVGRACMRENEQNQVFYGCVFLAGWGLQLPKRRMNCTYCGTIIRG